MNLQSYKRIKGNQAVTAGQARKFNSDMIMLNTWDNDIQSKKCYIYDYYHDKDGEKTPIDAKYIVTQYGSLSKDQVEYHILFKPNSGCALDYYKYYQERYNANYPIGLYIDIPDADGNYKKWLICSTDNEQQFVKHSILPCNYEFKWIRDGKKYSMWGVARLRNSYNSGIWVDHMTTTVENQDQMWLPMNDISDKLYYGDRIMVSALIEKPITWKIAKVENIHPFGLNKLTLSQDKFNEKTDYVNLDTGEMYADYYASSIEPEPHVQCKPPFSAKIVIAGSDFKIRVPNYRRKITLDFGEEFVGKVNWHVSCDDINIVEMLNIEYEGNNNEVLFLSTDNFDAVGSVIEVYASDFKGARITETEKLEVVSF